MNLVQNYIGGILTNAVSGFVDAGVRTAGGYAGDLAIKAGDAIERTGSGLGQAIENKTTTWATSLTGGRPSTGTVTKKLPSTSTAPRKAITGAGSNSARRPVGPERKKTAMTTTNTTQKTKAMPAKPSPQAAHKALPSTISPSSLPASQSQKKKEQKKQARPILPASNNPVKPNPPPSNPQTHTKTIKPTAAPRSLPAPYPQSPTTSSTKPPSSTTTLHHPAEESKKKKVPIAPSARPPKGTVKTIANGTAKGKPNKPFGGDFFAVDDGKGRGTGKGGYKAGYQPPRYGGGAMTTAGGGGGGGGGGGIDRTFF